MRGRLSSQAADPRPKGSDLVRVMFEPPATVRIDFGGKPSRTRGWPHWAKAEKAWIESVQKEP